MWLEFHVEEPSMEAALEILIPRITNSGISPHIINYRSKQSLIKKLPQRLAGIKHFVQDDMKYIVVVDRDRDDCQQLKQELNNIIRNSGLRAKEPGMDIAEAQVYVRIPIEELEAWFLGDFAALHKEFPRIPLKVAQSKTYRDPDSVSGGTWETLEKLLQRYNYYSGGLPKIEFARRISPHLSLTESRSNSFLVFAKLVAALAQLH